MNINELTIGEAREIAGLVGSTSSGACSSGPWRVGRQYAIRTVTMIQVGKLVAVHPQELVLESASWIADTGRFGKFCDAGAYDECEPMGIAIVGRGAIVDAVEWPYGLPEEAK